MKYEFTGKSLESAVRQAVSQSGIAEHQQKGFRSTRATAPPLYWGGWVDAFSQFGVVGSEKDNHVTRVNLVFSIVSGHQSAFDVEISGGDRHISTIGPGPETVTITGNVATTLRVRCKSHSLPLVIDVSADW